MQRMLRQRRGFVGYLLAPSGVYDLCPLFFNVFNARVETGSTFTAHFFSNRLLWLALVSMVGLQVVAVHWSVAQALFQTTDLLLTEWGIASVIAASILLLEELRKVVRKALTGRKKRLHGTTNTLSETNADCP